MSYYSLKMRKRNADKLEYKSLDDIFDDDPFGVLENKPVAKPISQDDRLANSFEEINRFVEASGREPIADKSNLNEYQLSQRLFAIRMDEAKAEQLKEYDVHGLLTFDVPSSIDDILGDDLLNSDDDDLFELKHVPKVVEQPDYIATRKPCKDFGEFESLFKECHYDLESGKRILKRFTNVNQIRQGDYFVQSGVVLYIADVGEIYKKNYATNGRLRVIYENGTESDILIRSLAAGLYSDGKRITENSDKLLDPLLGVGEDDEEGGYIYVLHSLSENSQIASIKNLYKIGFSRGPVNARIKNAEKDPTYLMAPVEVVEEYRVFNINVQRFEHLLHKFFGEVQLDAEVINVDGFKNSANEWYVAPFSAINTAVDLLVSGEIVDYTFDLLTQEIKRIR